MTYRSPHGRSVVWNLGTQAKGGTTPPVVAKLWPDVAQKDPVGEEGRWNREDRAGAGHHVVG